MASPLLTPVMTLPEYLKGPDVPEGAKPFIQMFAESSDIAQALPFEGLGGSPVFEGYRQSGIPTLAFRAINEGSTSGAGTITPFQESTYVIDHDIPVDRAIVDRGGPRRRAMEEANGMAALGQLFVNQFLKGDNTVQPRGFNGLQKRAAKFGRTIANSAASGGGPLSLAQLDLAIQNTHKPTHIIMPWSMKYLWIQAARTTTLTGFVTQTWDDMGRPKLAYAGLPMLFGYEKTLNTPILPFTEVGSGGGSAVTSSLYVVSFGEDGLRGIQIKPMQATDVGLLQDQITYNTHISWDVGLVDQHEFCFTRLSSITLAAIVA